MNSNTPTVILVLRWTARVLGTFIAGMLLLFMIGNHYNPFTMQLRDAVHTLFMPVAVLIGLLLAWRWELLGGALATGGMVGWYAMMLARSGQLNAGWAPLVIAVPGLLFLWVAARRPHTSTPTTADARP
jgi:hypothetical protein